MALDRTKEKSFVEPIRLKLLALDYAKLTLCTLFSKGSVPSKLNDRIPELFDVFRVAEGRKCRR